MSVCGYGNWIRMKNGVAYHGFFTETGWGGSFFTAGTPLSLRYAKEDRPAGGLLRQEATRYFDEQKLSSFSSSADNSCPSLD
jgi:hypothetical protein